MGRPSLLICVKCDDAGKARARGDRLLERVKKLRKALNLKDSFAVEEVKCLGHCDQGCVVQLEGKHRPTYTRVHVHAEDDAGALVKAARRYSELERGEALPSRQLPGDDPFA